MKFKNKKVILLDLDGTLVDSAPDLALALNLMLTKLNVATYSENIIRSWVGNGAQTLVKRGLLGKSAIDEAVDPFLFKKALATFLEFYKDNLCVKTVLYPNVYSTLISLHNRGYKMAIVTNKPIAFVQPMLDALAIGDMFELSLGGDSLEKRKPDAMPLLHVCEALHVKLDEAIMIGDSKNDILAAKAAGIESIGVSYGYNYGEDIGLHKPEYIVDDFAKILDLLY